MSEKLTLESLPSVIQDSICEYLQAPDLLNLALLSKSLYWAAVGGLYKSITITDQLSYKLAKGRISNWRVNYGTSLPYKKFEKLVQTICVKKELGELVHKFTFHHRIKFDEVVLGAFLAHTPHLQEFHNFSKYEIPQETAEKLRGITCVLGQSLKWAKNLRELRIRDFHNRVTDYPEDEEREDETSEEETSEDESTQPNDTSAIRDIEKNKQLAKDLVESGAYAGLKTLHISSG